MSIFSGKEILVTGGCGSIGSEIVSQLLSHHDPAVVRVLDHNESGHFFLNQKLQSNKIRNLIGDVRDRSRVFRAMEGIDVVFHAAALKHVPFCEYNPFEAVMTNVIGTKHIVEAAIDRGVERIVGVSTDKAVSPVNTMGATKLLSEKILVNAPVGSAKLKCCCVRFGNVLNSVGSVIPIFRHQISQGGPITLTDPEMTRYFMTIPNAVELVLTAGQKMTGHEVFILKMPVIRIDDLADVLIEALAPQYGYRPEDIRKEVIGIRPGEKMDEHLFSPEELPLMHEDGDLFVLRNSHWLPREERDNGTMEEFQKRHFVVQDKNQIRTALKQEGIIS